MIYTEQAQSAIAAAKKAAKELKHPYVGTEHLLLGLFRTRTGVAAQVMSENGVDEESMVKVIRELLSVSSDKFIDCNAKIIRQFYDHFKIRFGFSPFIFADGSL